MMIRPVWIGRGICLAAEPLATVDLGLVIRIWGRAFVQRAACALTCQVSLQLDRYKSY